MSSIEPKISIDNQKKQSFTPTPMKVMPVPPNVTLSPANTFGSISFIHQITVTPGSAQIGTTPPADLLQQLFNIFANLYTQIPLV